MADKAIPRNAPTPLQLKKALAIVARASCLISSKNFFYPNSDLNKDFLGGVVGGLFCGQLSS